MKTRIEISDDIPMESPSSQKRFPFALPDWDKATSNVNGFPRPRIRLGPGVCIGMMKPPRIWTLIFSIGAVKLMKPPVGLSNLTPDVKSYQVSCGI